MQLKDKVVIVTGSARGLGRAFALRVAKEGAKVVVCDILDCAPVAAEIEAMGGQALALKTDVTSEESTTELAQKTVERFGRIDVIVNNAGLFGGIEKKDVEKMIEDIRPDEWDLFMKVNTRGTFLCCKAVIPYMKKQGKGKIINIASTTPFSGVTTLLHYASSKGAVVAMTKTLARGMGEYNITVNAVAPGLIWTEAQMAMIGAERAQGHVDNGQIIKKPIMAEHIAGGVVFLASDDADMVTGHTLFINAGEYM